MGKQPAPLLALEPIKVQVQIILPVIPFLQVQATAHPPVQVGMQVKAGAATRAGTLAKTGRPAKTGPPGKTGALARQRQAVKAEVMAPDRALEPIAASVKVQVSVRA